MEWSDEAIILAARPHGEGHAVVDLFTPERGRWAGLVFGGSGRRMAPIVQPGNSVQAVWQGRLEESLGNFNLELTVPRAAHVMQERLCLAGLSAACAMAVACLPEREPHENTYRAMEVLLSNFEDLDIWPALMARWELGLLGDMGFGLTLDRCVATGSRDNLVYVSPKSACAVSKEAGAPYKDKMLMLPPFLKGDGGDISLGSALEALNTTGYFIETRILHLINQTLPEARIRVISLLQEKAQTVID